MNLEDAESALSPTDFRLFVNTVRRLESTLGMGDLSLTEIENDYRKRVLKVAVASTVLTAGTALGPNNTALRRVQDPDQSGFIRREDLYGRRILQNVTCHTQIIRAMLDD